MNENVLAIDPGQKKCGIAIVSKEKELILGRIVETTNLVQEIKGLIKEYQVSKMVVGQGTNSKSIIKCLSTQLSHVGLFQIAEMYTTLEARKRYFDTHPPRGLLRLLPKSLLVPPRPYDDYAAWLIAERFLSKYRP